MPSTPHTPQAGALASIRRAAERLNPCLDLEVDLLAVERAAICSTYEDWTAAPAAVQTDTVVERTGQRVQLAPTSSALLEQAVVNQLIGFADDIAFLGTPDTMAHVLDVFVEPAAVGGAPVTLFSLTLWLAQRRNASQPSFSNARSYFEITVGTYDEQWRFVPIGDPIRIRGYDVPRDGGEVTIPFVTGYFRRFTLDPAWLAAPTGPGRTSSGVIQPADNFPRLVPRAFSLQIRAVGPERFSAGIGAATHATVPGFVTSALWRYGQHSGFSNRHLGPYDPAIDGARGIDPNVNPDDVLGTGAVPGFGAKAIALGGATVHVGAARRVTAGRTQLAGAENPTVWPYLFHRLQVVSYPATGAIVKVFDLGATPVHPVQLRVDDVQPRGTAIAYSVRGAPDVAGPWTALGAVVDGQTFTDPAALFRCYELTAVFTPGPAAGTRYVTPLLQAAAFLERRRFSTTRHRQAIDSDSAIDPLTGQSKISELPVPLLRAGGTLRRHLATQRAPDLATRLATDYAPSRLEAHVYAVNTRDPNPSTRRYFLNSFRLNNREPGRDAERFTFTSGLDRLKVRVPAEAETYSFPAADAIATIQSYVAADLAPLRPTWGVDIVVAGTPFIVGALIGLRCRLWPEDPTRTRDYTIGLRAEYTPPSNTNTASSFRIEVPTEADVPPAGTRFEIHSDVLPQAEAVYDGEDLADVFTAIRDDEARLPARLRGVRPAADPARATTTRRLVTGQDASDKAAEGLSVLQHLALILGGGLAWVRGRIDFVDLYGPKEPVLAWDERHLVSLTPTLGADRRQPLLEVKYGWNQTAEKFAGQLRAYDADALDAWGVATIDPARVPDDLCKWFTTPEAARTFAVRQLDAWSTGVRLWAAETVFCYPWLEEGDAVRLRTDQYTDRRFRFGNQLADEGTPIRGRVAAVGVIVGKNLWGNRFLLAVRGTDQIQGADVVAGAGVLGGPLDPVPTPADFDATVVTQGSPPNHVVQLKATYTPPATPYFAGMEYRVRSKPTGAPDASFTVPSLVVGGATGADLLDAAYGRDFELTPITRSTGGARFEGTPVRRVTGANPAADPTFQAPIAEASRIVYRWTWDEDSRWLFVYSRKGPDASAPALQNIEGLAPAPVAIIQRESGQTQLALDVDATDDCRNTTFVAVDAYNRRGLVQSYRTLRNAAAAAPNAPAAVTSPAKTYSTVTIRVEMPAAFGATVPDVVRLVRGGVAVLEVARVAAAGATQDVVDTGLDPSNAYTYQAELVAAGVSSARVPVTPLSVTTDAATIDPPTLDSAVRRSPGVVDLAWTAGANTPAGAVYVVSSRPTPGDPWTELYETTSTTASVLVAPGTEDFSIEATRQWWTSSLRSNVVTA